MFERPQIDPGVLVGVMVYPSGDIQLVRKKTVVNGGLLPQFEQKIVYLSSRARARMLFVLRNTAYTFKSMFTLSYPKDFPCDGLTVKANLNTWLTWFRRNYRGALYFWFLEFQKRGAPHIHLYFTEAKNRFEQHRMAMSWAITVCGKDWQERKKCYRVHNHPKQLTNEHKKSGLLRYATKYALKTEQKAVPRYFQNVGRFWGCSRQVTDSIPEGKFVEMTDNDLNNYLDHVQHRVKGWDIKPRLIFGCFT